MDKGASSELIPELTGIRAAQKTSRDLRLVFNMPNPKRMELRVRNP